MSRESNLEEQVKKRGIIIVGVLGENSGCEITHKKLMDIMDSSKGHDIHAIYLAPGGHPTEALEYAIMKAREAHSIVFVADFAHKLNIETSKFPEVRILEVPDLGLRESPKYLFEEILDKNFNNKGYLPKIRGSQINYKKKF